MGITLRAMCGDEFEGYLEYFIPDYAAEIASNYDVSLEAARARAVRETGEDLAQGVETTGQVLLCIISGADLVGYLWYKPDHKARTAFIYDFYILPAHRGQRFGKQALIQLETLLSGEGIMQIGLRVAADNAPAQSMYNKGGYRATGINMIKRIGSD